MYGLPEKEILKTQKELIDLHKRVLENYLRQLSAKLTTRKNFFKVYDHYISENNIQRYFFLPSEFFVRILIFGEVQKSKTKRRKK